jgi:hypothetical protein
MKLMVLIGSFLLCGIIIISCYQFRHSKSIPGLIAPTGSFQVGTTTYHMTDTQRVEQHADNVNTKRELMVQIWYPAASNIMNPRNWTHEK